MDDLICHFFSPVIPKKCKNIPEDGTCLKMVKSRNGLAATSCWSVKQVVLQLSGELTCRLQKVTCGVIDWSHADTLCPSSRRQRTPTGRRRWKNRFSSKIQSIPLLGFSKLGLAFLMSCRNSVVVRWQEISIAVN